MFDALDRFHHSKLGYTVFAIIELALAYVFISWAIDDGSWWDYLLALIFTVGFFQNVVKLIGAFIAARKRHIRLNRK